MADRTFRTYACSYGYGGHQWSIPIMATSQADAEARLRAIGAWGRVDGALIARIPVPAGSPLQRVWRWVKARAVAQEGQGNG